MQSVARMRSDVAAPQPLQKSSALRTALILYGSETGNAQDVAEEVGRMAERLRFATTVLDMDSIQLRDLLWPTVVIFILSTTGQGEMPQNARVFWKTLLSGALKPGVLRKIRFSSFGLGDSSYVQFNIAHRMLCNRLIQLGAQPFCDRGEGNEQHPEGHSAGLREWIVMLKSKLLEVFPLQNELQPIPDGVCMKPKWQLDVSSTVNTASRFDSTTQNGLAKKELQEVPSSQLLPVTGSHRAMIHANDRMTARDHFQDVRLIDLGINDPWDYGPGAIAVVYPKNFPGDVQEFIDLMNWGDIADRTLILNSNITTPTARQNPSPLRHLNLDEINLTLRWLLENVLDFMAIPRRSFFAELAHFVGEATEDEAYQKERLLELANPELIDELWDYTTRPKRTILEVMMDFTTVKIPWEYALSLLPIMKGRQFSIASGGVLRKYNDGNTRVQLLVAIADPPSPIIKWRRRYGVCTRYMATFQAGQEINIGLQQGYLDVHPSEMEVPVIMIGPGTGLAPMRSMIYQRHAWAQNLPHQHDPAHRLPDHGLDGDILLFGCRNRLGDFFFESEWEQFRRDDALAVLVAFSRDTDQPKQYVQDLIRANGPMIYNALVARGGKVYVCGSSGNMPKGVRQALLDVLVAHDVEMTDETAAAAYLDQLEKNGRYKQETW